MFKLSAFADEVVDDFLEQVRYLDSENVSHIELRFLNKKNLVDLNNSELKDAKKILQDYDLRVSAIGSPIGKVRLDESFPKHLDMFKHVVDLAMLFEAPFIRMFSFYAPAGKHIDDCRGDVMKRMEAMLEVIDNVDVVMVHENEANIYGHTASNCVDLMQTFDSHKLRLVYDPANFVWGEKISDNMTSCWPLMKPYVAHIHIKDWEIGAKVGSIPGEGDGQIKELLAELKECGYQGCLTMEPHLQVGGQFGGDTGPELFSRAIAAVRGLASQVGMDCE